MHLRNVQSLVHFFPNRHKSKVKARGSACVGIAVRQYANVYVLMQIHESFFYRPLRTNFCVSFLLFTSMLIVTD